ncbi:polypeptide N-acetylgalactosaminyltransferase [Caerostris extrusa]|uniref:Polypeptide N-acetylgalactosaminyltransferase n=1 Tax=Caerostris extrusa TaxID=172846 RepID=A0AAV4VN82_CAEEX|nr:polypeptide N-acetylgalactosaminyltransferase [Caerostris extrusa]
MARRKRKRLCRMFLTLCIAVFCVGLLLRAAVTSLGLRTFIEVDLDKDTSNYNVPGIYSLRHKHVKDGHSKSMRNKEVKNKRRRSNHVLDDNVQICFQFVPNRSSFLKG